jgi:ATP-dependent DNA helicase RecG
VVLSLDIDSLRKVLELERKKGYTDTAVIGGLDKFLRNWVAQALKSGGPKPTRRFKELKLSNSDYASLNGEQRKAWLDEALRFLTKLKGSGVEEPPAAPLLVTTRRVRSKPIPSPVANASLDSPITVLRGISASLATRFKKLGVITIRDLLYFFPHRHLDYSQRKSIAQLEIGREETIIANVWQTQRIRMGSQPGTEAVVGDETGNIRIVWFNNPYIARQLKTNTRIMVSGRVSLFNRWPVFESPEWEAADEEGELIHTGRLVPVYPLTQGLRPRPVRKLMKEVVDRWAAQVRDALPPGLKKRCHLLDLDEAITQAHYPDDAQLKDRARVRLAFDELLLLQLGVLNRKRRWQEGQPGNAFQVKDTVLSEFLGSLPFEFTGAQRKVMGEIFADLQKTLPMSRLLQGDVGSGKTVVATVALLMAAANGYQGAFMAPTEILAEQHFRSIGQLLGPDDDEEVQDNRCRFRGLDGKSLEVARLIGDISQSRKQEIQRQVAGGEIDIVIGTHALIQKEVKFHRLGLAVVDEQHRFGVEQRSALRQKGFNPHVLVMTATPIPRTLALTLYGDLDLSVIDQMPPGRQAVKTRWLGAEERHQAYAFMKRQVQAGHQAFIICPLIEESEAIQARAAVAEHRRLEHEVFPDLKLGLLHGRLPSAEKDLVMRRFHNGELDVLVSTAVVEVGIDVPNATVMLVESADRFGLSQLHQFRGRVGRGAAQSYCILIAQYPSDVARQRLDIIERVHDGFVLAEEDLKLRGPGEFFGTRQSGLPDLRMARLSDVALLEMARREATGIFQADASLKKPEHELLAAEVSRVWRGSDAEWS